MGSIPPNAAAINTKTDPKREYIAGGNLLVSSELWRVLTSFIDEVTKEVDEAAYEKMLADPAVNSAFEILKGRVLADGVRVQPAVQSEESEGFEQAKQYAEFIERAFLNLARHQDPIVVVLDEMMDAFAHGHCLAERTLMLDEEGPDKGKLTLRFLKPKSRKLYSFVVDEFYNVLGIVGKSSLRLSSRNLARQADEQTVKEESKGAEPMLAGQQFLPRSRFALLTFQGRAGDPRGRSLLRAAYNPWYIKNSLWPELLKFLIRFGSPALALILPEDVPSSQPVWNDDGTPALDESDNQKMEAPEDAAMRAMLNWANGTVAVFKGGSKLEKVQSQDGGGEFERAFDLFDRQIMLAILRTTRANMEARHGSKADSGVAQDVVDVFVDFLRIVVGAMIDRDVVAPLIEANFGAKALELSPMVTLSAAQQTDRAQLMDGVAKLTTAGYLHSSQFVEVDQMLDLPERDMEAIEREKEEQQSLQQQTQSEAQKLLNPGSEEDEEEAIA